MTDATSGFPPGAAGADISTFVKARAELITRDNRRLKAVITVTPETARVDCIRVVRARQEGKPLPLDGMTVVVKDNIDVGGVPGTLGSGHFRHRRPVRDAAVVQHIRRAGGVVFGTANLHELAYGGTSSNPHFGSVRNPWAVDRIPGGSSGGSAVAVAAGWVTAALGTDTGGSVRCPASMTGVTGLRPTFGSLSRHGVYPLAKTFDTVGCLARRATDIEKLMIAGGWRQSSEARSTEPLRIGLPSNSYFRDLADPAIAQVVAEVGDLLTSHGHLVRDIEVPSPELCDEVARLLVRSEAFALHGERIVANEAEFGSDVVGRVLLGRQIGSGQLATLRTQRHELAAAMDVLFDSVDFLLLPTVPNPPAFVGQGDMVEVTERNLAFTYMWGVGGFPAISFPCGFSPDNMPIGAQLIGPRGSDRSMCGVVRVIQEDTTWHLRHPGPR